MELVYLQACHLKKINLRGGLNLYTYSGKDIELGYKAGLILHTTL